MEIQHRALFPHSAALFRNLSRIANLQRAVLFDLRVNPQRF